MKSAEREKAREYYVEHLLSINTILKLVDNVSRKSLFNWKKEDQWDLKRSEFLKNNSSNRELLDKVYKAAAGSALQDPDEPMKLFGLGKIVGAMEAWNNSKLDDFENPKLEKEEQEVAKKFISSETIKSVKKVLGMVE